MILGPFINVVSLIMLLYTAVLYGSSFNNADTKKTMAILTAYFFPFFLLYGFCLSSGIYMIVSLLDKEKKMRQYMYLAGVGPFSYYLGLYAADFLLFCITEIIFVIFVLTLQMQAYSSSIGQFCAIMTTFGFVLIPFTYLFQHFFRDSNSAFRNIGWVYICLGMFFPALVMLIFELATSAAGSTKGFTWGRSICFFIDPFNTFYFGVFDLIFVYVSKTY